MLPYKGQYKAGSLDAVQQNCQVAETNKWASCMFTQNGSTHFRRIKRADEHLSSNTVHTRWQWHVITSAMEWNE